MNEHPAEHESTVPIRSIDRFQAPRVHGLRGVLASGGGEAPSPPGPGGDDPDAPSPIGEPPAPIPVPPSPGPPPMQVASFMA